MSRTSRAIYIFSAIVLLLSACGKKSTTAAFDGSVPQDQQLMISNDFDALRSIDLPLATRADAQVLGISDFKGETLNNWFTPRVSTFVGENFNSDANSTKTALANQTAPSILADMRLAATGSSNIVTLALNVGSELYLEGKSDRSIYSLRTQNGVVQIKSPRVGIVQIGDGLISTAIQSSALGSMANSFLRLAVLFHEARHSDGNGDNAGFPHAMCSAGDYAGNYACENNKNGPYAVQATLLKLMYSACVKCTQGELSSIQLDLTDYNSRMVNSPQFRDERPEGYH